MADLNPRCNVCQAMLDEEDLFCANCGTEAPPPATDDLAGDQRGAMRVMKHSFECQSCGASMSYDPQAQTLQCPFCGSQRLSQHRDTRTMGPSRIVPFAITRTQAEAALRSWLGRGFWRPGDLSQRAAITKMSQVYVPYWIFTARTHSYWTADTNQTPAGARGDWFPLFGENRATYQGLLIGASGVLTPAETTAICPFDLDQALPAHTVDLDRFKVEQFRVQRKYARPLARQSLEALESQACEQFVPGRCRNLKVNVRLEGLSSEPVLLPVWVMAYRYQDQVYRFLLNAQTGRATGHAPTSWNKVLIAVLLAFALLLLLLILGGLLSR